jgi:hypothetical protein
MIPSMADQNAENVLVPLVLFVRYGWDKKLRLEILVLVTYISSRGICYNLNGESVLVGHVHGHSGSSRQVHWNCDVKSPQRLSHARAAVGFQ